MQNLRLPPVFAALNPNFNRLAQCQRQLLLLRFYRLVGADD
jgi:hypothetical protein